MNEDDLIGSLSKLITMDKELEIRRLISEFAKDLDSIIPKKGWWNDDMVLDNIRELKKKWEK